MRHAPATLGGAAVVLLLALGGNARAGLEDTLYLRKGELARGNSPLVRRAVELARALDRPVADVKQAEALLSLN